VKEFKQTVVKQRQKPEIDNNISVLIALLVQSECTQPKTTLVTLSVTKRFTDETKAEQ
jgi:hypothetical protein